MNNIEWKIGSIILNLISTIFPIFFALSVLGFSKAKIIISRSTSKSTLVLLDLIYLGNSMNSKYPLLDVKKPHGETYTISLEKFIKSQPNICINIGRQDTNHIVLSDPQKQISRHHCSIQNSKGRWWIVDEGSSNGTFISRKTSQSEIDVRSEDIIPLENGDDILILGELSPSEQPLFWRLKFIDPGETNQVKRFQNVIGLEYSLSQKKLFRNTSRSREEIYLRDQELNAIDYMSRKNHENQNQAVVCEYQEIIKAVWQDNDFGIDRKDVNHLIWRIRDKIEYDSGESRFLKTVRGKGYRLEINVID